MKSKEISFNEKLKELVKEFNDLKIDDLKAKGDTFGLHDFFLELNYTGLTNRQYKLIRPFVNKYNASVGISPVTYNDCICIRIDDCQFNLKY
jgi:hypothetical protein